MSLYEKIQDLCRKNGYEISRLCVLVPDLNISRASLTGWKKGAKPRADKIKKIADYFGVPISYFSDDSAKIEVPLPTDGLTDEERKLLEKFRGLSEDRKALAIRLLDPLEESQ